MERLARRNRAQMVTNHNTPRSIRSRLSFPRRKLAPADTSAAPDAPPAQAVVHSASGKMALGPWMGPFAPVTEGAEGQDPPSPTVFATSQGRVFADLAGSPVASMDMAGAAMEVMAAPAHPEAERGMRLAARDEMSALRRKAQAGRVPRSRGPRVNSMVRKTRMIQQARKAN